MLEKIQGGIIGVAVGDALGVPVEFKSREYLKANPIRDLIGYGSWNQPPGTWSDDTSLTLCLLEGLIEDFDIENIGSLFVKWYKEGYWGAHNKVFDIGGSTRYALDRIFKGESAKFSGSLFEEENGNGSLMRTLPLIYFLKDIKEINELYKVIKDVSSITHAHFRSCFSCFVYCVLGIRMLQGDSKNVAYKNMQSDVERLVASNSFNAKELKLFDRILRNNIWEYKEEEIQSSGYVLDALEASLWCLYTSNSYEEAVLKAVNLGRDTDTTGAITGGLAGLYYGFESIPEVWKFRIARYDDIESLILKFKIKLEKNENNNSI
ncbi:ADP-ribosylglycohydrolase family protein [Seonamhaeicola marinus]|uniref:ADP-ribosylglycohydrolase family protein n=1 Tax=Seonamhaeicola marinus TaxID=1912246 RepID=A0A5D0I5Y0_9FLAO|nr:ADP-ribosylglycohydrolase family protein [Seonamhaeicola marinus]